MRPRGRTPRMFRAMLSPPQSPQPSMRPRGRTPRMGDMPVSMDLGLDVDLQ